MANIAQFKFEVKGLEEVLRVVQFKSEETISKPFLFQLNLASEAPEINFDDVIGKAAVFTTYDHDAEEARIVNGIVHRFEQVGEGQRFTHYYLELVPQLYLLSYRANSRIFQNLSIPDIIKVVLENAGIASDCFRFSLCESYSPREYCVQYDETDFNFVSRLMEEEGIFYFFEHSKDSHILVIADSSNIHTEIENPIISYNKSSLLAEEGFIHELRYSEVIKTGSVKLTDFNFKRPELNLQVQSQAESDTHLEVYDFPGFYELTERGDSLASIKLESLRALKKSINGRSNCRYLLPGYLFTLKYHPRSGYNRKYLVTALIQSGSQPQVLEEEAQSTKTEYKNEFVGIPDDVPYRPPQIARKPRIDGVQTAIVVGPGGEEIYTNEHGCVKVQFHWDLEGRNDDKSSCWVRVSQLWAGAGWGAMYIPRIGHEVIVTFVEGNPDRPIISGRVYHASNTPPYSLPDEKTKSTIKSNTTKGGGGSNEIRFDDASGSEEIFIHAQKDENIAVENDQGIVVGHNRTESIGNNRTLDVGTDKYETVGNNKTIEVGAGHTEQIGASMNITVGSTLTETVGVNYAETVGGAMELTVGGALAITVGAAMAETIGGAKVESVGGIKSENIGVNKSLDVGANLSESVGKDRTVEIGKNLKQTIGGAHEESVAKEYIIKAKKMQFVADDEINIKTGKAEIIMKKNGDITIKGKKINVKGSSDVIIKGSKIKGN